MQYLIRLDGIAHAVQNDITMFLILLLSHLYVTNCFSTADRLSDGEDTMRTVRSLYAFIRNGISAFEVSVLEQPIEDFMLELLSNHKPLP